MTFTITKLVGHRTMVAGTDRNGVDGQQVLDTSEWDSLSENKDFTKALEDYDAAVKAHFADITKAAERLEAARSKGDDDPLTYVVQQEAVEGAVGRPEIRRRLSHDSQVLRVLENGDHDRLVWVAGVLEIAEVVPQVSNPAVPGIATNG